MRHSSDPIRTRPSSCAGAMTHPSLSWLRVGWEAGGRQIGLVIMPAIAWFGLVLFASLIGCSASTHPTRPSTLGRIGEVAQMESLLSTPGSIRFERIVAADWEVARSGMINFDHPKVREAELEDGPEAIEIFFYVLEHPLAGDFMVDSGVAADFATEDGSPDVATLVEAVMNTEALDIHLTTSDWLAARPRPLSGIFLTHIHLDHVMGLPDVPEGMPIYTGPGETNVTAFLNLFTQGTLDRLLEGSDALYEWPFEAPSEDEISVVDVFGDGMLWALHVPGHTPGSTAFVVRSTEGTKLLVGDTSHTQWGWNQGVEPGTFTADHAQNAASLGWLRRFAARHPEIEVHLGHQRLD